VSGFLSGRVALVTGASRGIGREVALELARAGGDVALAARNAGPAEELAVEIRGLGVKAMALSLDVSDLAAVETAATKIEGELGKVSILVNNAGITRDQLLVRMKEDDWSEVLQINLGGTFHCTKVFVKGMMRARWGRVINISSVVGTTGNPGQANYSASKAGIVGFTRSVARELASRNVTVNAVAPGYIETAMTEELSPEIKGALLKSIPLGRLGTPGDVAKVVTFLCGDDSGYITGQVIHVDGGMVMA
jgi:3-oxoacyl-[acyl-carrier protein] reductase